MTTWRIHGSGACSGRNMILDEGLCGTDGHVQARLSRFIRSEAACSLIMIIGPTQKPRKFGT